MSKVTFFVCKCNSKYDLLMLSIKNLWRYLLFNYSVVSSTKIELLTGINTSKVIGTASGEGWRYQAKTNYFVRGGSRATAISRMKHFVIIVNSFQPLTIITKRFQPLIIITKCFISDVAAVLDPPHLFYLKTIWGIVFDNFKTWSRWLFQRKWLRNGNSSCKIINVPVTASQWKVF